MSNDEVVDATPISSTTSSTSGTKRFFNYKIDVTVPCGNDEDNVFVREHLMRVVGQIYQRGIDISFNVQAVDQFDIYVNEVKS